MIYPFCVNEQSFFEKLEGEHEKESSNKSSLVKKKKGVNNFRGKAIERRGRTKRFMFTPGFARATCFLNTFAVEMEIFDMFCFMTRQEEFQTAADLLSRALWVKDKPDERKNSKDYVEVKSSATSQAQSGYRFLQSPGAVTTTSVAVSDSNSGDCSFVGKSSVFKAEKQLVQCETDSQQQKQNLALLTPESDRLSKSNHNMVGFNDNHFKTELENLHITNKEQDLESDDELEQFVFQPKADSQRDIKF